MCKTATSGLPGAKAEQSDEFLSSGRSPQAPRHAHLPSTSGMPRIDLLWPCSLKNTTHAMHVMVLLTVTDSAAIKAPPVAYDILMAPPIPQQA